MGASESFAADSSNLHDADVKTRQSKHAYSSEEIQNMCNSLLGRYISVLKDLEKALSMQKIGVVVDCLTELYWCDRDAQGIQSGELFQHLQKHRIWKDLTQKRNRLAKQSLGGQYALYLNAKTRNPDCIVITCMNMSGAKLAEIRVNPSKKVGDLCRHMKMGDLRRQILEKVPLPEGAPKDAAWVLISKRAGILDADGDSVRVSEALGQAIR